MDLSNAKENLNALRQRFPMISIVPISAAKGEGIDALKGVLSGKIPHETGNISYPIKSGQGRNL
jgi:50S ribosomal subunit-associated GTPase HflX